MTPVSFATVSAMATMRALTRSSSVLVITSGTMISASTGLPVALAGLDRAFENGARLHFGDFRKGDGDAHAAEAEHRIELVQFGGAALELGAVGAHGGGDFGDLARRYAAGIRAAADRAGGSSPADPT